MEEEQINMLLAEVIAGERSEQDPEVVAALQSNPELAASLKRRQSLGRVLSGVGEDLQSAPPVGEEAKLTANIVSREVANFASDLQGAEAEPKGGAVHWGWFTAAAAAAAIALIVWFSSDGSQGSKVNADPGPRYMPSGPEIHELAATRDVQVGEAVTWDFSQLGFEADDAIQIDIHLNPDDMFSDDEGVKSFPLQLQRTWTSPPDLFNASEQSTASLKLYRLVDRELKLVGQQSLVLQR